MDTHTPTMKMSQTDVRYTEEFKRLLNTPTHDSYNSLIDYVNECAIEQLNSKHIEFDSSIQNVLLSEFVVPRVKMPITKGKVRYRGLRLAIQDTFYPLTKVYIISQRGKVIAKIVN